MLVFAGLWGHCDRHGRFEWKPRLLKLDILPFLTFDMADTLNLLVDSGFIRRYSSDGGEYGVIPTFEEHQRISGKEASDSKCFPEPQTGSDGEAPEKAGREGKGREQERSNVPPKKAEQRKAAAEIIGFLNAKAGRHFSENGANADFVIARLNEGASVGDCKAVIAMKCREWKGDEKMTDYLRPETLFNRTKFASYMGKIGAA